MRYVPALILDAVLVLIFAAIGRASHDEDPAGFLLTAWPFVIALLVGHAIAALLPARPRRPWSLLWGAVVWVVTVAGGMVLRVVGGDTAQVPFIVVATIVLGVFLLGWRALAALMRRRRGARAAGSDGIPVRADDAGSHDPVAAEAVADAETELDGMAEAVEEADARQDDSGGAADHDGEAAR